jgi:hypothetical protein
MERREPWWLKRAKPGKPRAIGVTDESAKTKGTDVEAVDPTLSPVLK